MRLNQVETEITNGKLNIEMVLPDSPFCVVYCNGKAKITTLPEHGETKVITHQGKVKRVKFDEGEEF
ncbi:XtrA/YqaO family protein [Halobacillus massiliensis]|uniref:XtrA/YqaO family protein n=1 Tax=Halobacillus massiliensis TaxID=1926286 RepID=UPI0009E318C4|nr:XtrA/YqaO family protein [Halobacillus massiliensis]